MPFASPVFAGDDIRNQGIIAPINLRPMTATGVLPGDVVIALAFVAVAAATAAAVVAASVGSLRYCSVARRELGLI